MTSPLDKVCIKIDCAWKSRCGMPSHESGAMHRQTFTPEFGADACPYFTDRRNPQDVSWGVGPDLED